MNELELWNRFRENGKVDDYLAYRAKVRENMQAEMNTGGKADRFGSCDKRTEYR